jgi:hypothetical protein
MARTNYRLEAYATLRRRVAAVMVLRLTELTLGAPKSNVAKFFDPIAAIKLLKSSLT